LGDSVYFVDGRGRDFAAGTRNRAEVTAPSSQRRRDREPRRNAGLFFSWSENQHQRTPDGDEPAQNDRPERAGRSAIKDLAIKTAAMTRTTMMKMASKAQSSMLPEEPGFMEAGCRPIQRGFECARAYTIDCSGQRVDRVPTREPPLATARRSPAEGTANQLISTTIATIAVAMPILIARSSILAASIPAVSMLSAGQLPQPDLCCRPALSRCGLALYLGPRCLARREPEGAAERYRHKKNYWAGLSASPAPELHWSLLKPPGLRPRVIAIARGCVHPSEGVLGLPTCGSPRGIAGNRDPLGEAAGQTTDSGEQRQCA
jgi:hypothetical protein